MIESYIPLGHENAVSRAYLVSVTGLSDREVRDRIQESDSLIISTGKGYFQYENESDLPYMKDYLSRETARLLTLTSKVKKLTRKYEELRNAEYTR